MPRLAIAGCLGFLVASCTDLPPATGDTTSTSSTSTGTDAPNSTTTAELPGPSGTPAATPLVQWVDPFIGTGGKGFGTGSAFPGPQRPFGLARPGPDTSLVGGLALGFAHCSGYSFEDTMVLGFSQTRMHGTGIVDYGAVSVMPTLGFTPAKAAPKGVMVGLDKASEQASPGRYAVALAGGDLVLDAPASDADNIYVDAATLDDVPLTSPRLHHADLAAGGLLRFDMTATPGSWGQAP